MSDFEPLAATTHLLAFEAAIEAEKARERACAGESAMRAVFEKLDRLASLRLTAVDGQFTDTESADYAQLRRWYHEEYQCMHAFESDVIYLPCELSTVRDWLTHNMPAEAPHFERFMLLLANGRSEQDFTELRGLFARLQRLSIARFLPFPSVLRAISERMLATHSAERFQMTAEARAQILGTFVQSA